MTPSEFANYLHDILTEAVTNEEILELLGVDFEDKENLPQNFPSTFTTLGNKIFFELASGQKFELTVKEI